MALAESTQKYEKKIADLIQQLKDEKARSVAAEEQLVASRKLLGDNQNIIQVSYIYVALMYDSINIISTAVLF